MRVPKVDDEPPPVHVLIVRAGIGRKPPDVECVEEHELAAWVADGWLPVLRDPWDQQARDAWLRAQSRRWIE